MLADDILQIEHLHDIHVTDAVHVNQYYHVIGRDKDCNPVELWLFADDLIEKAVVSHTTHKYLDLLGIEYNPHKGLEVTIVNNQLLCIRVAIGYVYYDNQSVLNAEKGNMNILVLNPDLSQMEMIHDALSGQQMDAEWVGKALQVLEMLDMIESQEEA